MNFLENNKTFSQVKIAALLTYKTYLKSYKVPYLQHLMLDKLSDYKLDLEIRKLFQKIKYIPTLKMFRWLDIKPHSSTKMKFEVSYLKKNCDDAFHILNCLNFGYGVRVESFFKVLNKFETIFAITNLKRLERESLLSVQIGDPQHPIPLDDVELDHVYLKI